MKIRPLVLSCGLSCGLAVVACGGSDDDVLFAAGGASGGSAGIGGATANAGSGGSTSTAGAGGGGGSSTAGTGGKGGTGGTSGKGGKGGTSGTSGKGGNGGAGEGGSDAGAGGSSAGASSTGGMGGGGANAGGVGGSGKAGEGGSSAGTGGSSAGTGGSTAGAGQGGSLAGGEAGSGGTGAAGTAGGGGTAGGPALAVEIIGKRIDKDANEFWVMADDLVWLGLPNGGGSRTPFRAPRAGGNGAKMSNAILGTQSALVPDTLNPAVFYDGQIAGQTGIGKYAFVGGASLAAITPDPVAHVASSTGHLCWSEQASGNTYRLVCRTRAEATRIVSSELWASVSSVAATTKWVYFTQGNTLRRWDRTANKAGKVADNIGRVKAIGDVVWGLSSDGHVVRVADNDSTIDYGPTFTAAIGSGITSGVTDKYLYLGLTPIGSTIPGTIVRVDENEGEVTTVVPAACATRITSVGANDKYVYFLCGDENIYRAVLP